MNSTKTRVLFLCTGNSARSQMAEALLRLDAGDRYESFSAGTEPKGVHPLTIVSMHEAGVDLTNARSKHIREFANDRLDYIISVCDRAKESCPVWPGGAKRVAWSFDDPAAAIGDDAVKLATFRRVRDEIRAQISKFIKTGG